MQSIDIALKDLLRNYRSLFMIGMMLVAPLAVTGLIFFAFSGMASGDVGAMPTLNVTVTNLDRPTETLPNLGQVLAEFLQDDGLPTWIETRVLSGGEAEARAAVNNREAGVAVVIPANFTNDLVEGRKTSILLIQDPTLTFGPAVIRELIGQFVDGVSGAQIAMQVVAAQAEAQGIALDEPARQEALQQYSDWYVALQKDLHHAEQPVLAVRQPAAVDRVEEANFIQVMLGNIMAGMLVFFVFYGGSFTAMSILKEDEEGTLARLFATPTPRSLILGGKFLGVLVTVTVQSVVLLLAARLAFGMSWGQPASVALALLGLVLAGSGTGVLLLSVIKTTRQAGPVLGGVLTFSGMLGGLFTTGMLMPPAFQTLNLFTPHGWAMKGLTTAMSGAGPAEVLPLTAVMVGIGAVTFALGVVIFRKRYA